jgi:hypothetical protein
MGDSGMTEEPKQEDRALRGTSRRSFLVSLQAQP